MFENLLGYKGNNWNPGDNHDTKYLLKLPKGIPYAWNMLRIQVIIMEHNVY